MQKKVVFFDIDGTMWDWDGIIPDSTMEAIRKLKANGHTPIICTGRSKGHIRDEKLLSLEFEGMIAACGSHVEYNGEILYEDYLDKELVKKIVEVSKECNAPIVLEGKKKHWISVKGFDKDPFVDRMIEAMGEDAILTDEYSDDMEVNKFAGDIIRTTDYPRLKNELGKDLFIIEHGNCQCFEEEDADENAILGVFEGIKYGTSKAMGIRMICEKLGIDISDTFGIGDSNNDIEMIQYVGTGIAMGNATEGLKKEADYVTTDIHEDGVYKALEHFGLI